MKKLFKPVGIFSFFLFPVACAVTFNDRSIESKPEVSIEEEIENEYVHGTDDIPLFKGFEPVKDETTNFDTVSGNILISSYRSQASLKEVKDFYAQTLPQLGWEFVRSEAGKFLYKRNNDKLEIYMKKENGQLVVKFSISSFL